MYEGLLWADFDKKRDLADKIARAADRYLEKFGCRPNRCYINSAQIDGLTEVNGVRVIGAHNILKFHFWIGVEEAAELRKAA
jgi:hypothetical protein